MRLRRVAADHGSPGKPILRKSLRATPRDVARSAREPYRQPTPLSG